MSPQFECRFTASLLDSGRLVRQASHCAALMAMAGLLLSRSVAARFCFAASMFGWLACLYLGVRVAVDASLFLHLAGQPEEGARALDEWLRAGGLSRKQSGRTLAERTRGARRLWIQLLVVAGLQLGLLALGALLAAGLSAGAAS